MQSFNNFFTPAPEIRTFLNLGCLMDIPTGRYYRGKHGESILSGGLAYITGVGGRGNTFKSVIAHFMNLRVLDRYSNAMLTLYDSETSVSYARMEMLSTHLPHLAGTDLKETGRVYLTDNTVMTGNKFFEGMRKFTDAKKKDPKPNHGVTPFIDKKGKNISAFIPTLFEIDSLSMFQTESVEKIYEKNEIGDSAANTDSLRGSAAKSQMLMQLPNLTGASGSFITMTAHVGDDIPLDPYAPPAKKLTFLKNKAKFKHVPEKFTFLTNNLWYVLGVQVLQNRGTKAPEYPRDKDDNMVGDTDLQIVQLQNLRAKNGPTGMPFELILSQSEGVLVGLTEFHYIKSFDRYGISGNLQNYHLDLYPDTNLSRTTIRGKIDSDPLLQRALEITSELCQMTHLWDDTDGLFCTPKELYDDLKAKGYDWSKLLDTRAYWVFEEHAKDAKPFLSTMDLLNMRKGLYTPYWL